MAQKRAFGKDDERLAAARGERELIGMLGAFLYIEALDEVSAQPADEGARDRIFAQLALGHESVVAPRQDGDQHHAVEVARVVGGDDVRAAARQVLQPAHCHRNPAQPEEKAREPLRGVPCPLAGGDERDDDDDGEKKHKQQPRPQREGETAHHAPAAAQLRRHAGGREAHDLPPHRLRLHRRRPALVVLARGDAADLAARGLGHGVRRREHDVVDRPADQVHRELVDAMPELVVERGVAAARFGEHHHALGAARAVHGAEHRDAAAADARQVADRLLQLVGADVAPPFDDDVLLAPGDVEHAAGHVGAVSRVHPFAREQALRGFGIAVVAGGGRRPPELELALVAVG